MERNLTIIPLVHVPGELDKDLSNPRNALVQKLSMQLFRGITGYIQNNRDVLGGTQVYFDSFPAEVMNKLNGVFHPDSSYPPTTLLSMLKKSPSIRVMRYMVKHGAILMGTEEESLVSKVADLNQSGVYNQTEWDLAMEDRDIAVGQTIDRTLITKGTLFMGSAHSVEKYVDAKIVLDTPQEVFRFFDHRLAQDLDLYRYFEPYIKV